MDHIKGRAIFVYWSWEPEDDWMEWSFPYIHVAAISRTASITAATLDSGERYPIPSRPTNSGPLIRQPELPHRIVAGVGYVEVAFAVEGQAVGAG